MPAKKVSLTAFLIFLGTFVVYASAFHNGFFWDDWIWVPWNLSLESWHGLAKIWLDPFALEVYPLTPTTFWFEYHVWGLNPFGYHLVNVLFHAANAVLVGAVLSKLGIRGAWSAAAIFAWHPVQVESVAWIAERKNVLSLFFYLLAVLSSIRFWNLDQSSTNEVQPKRFYGLTLLFFLCSILSKSIACTFPFVALILLWWKRDQIKKRDVFLLAPIFVISLVIGLMTILIERIRIEAKGTGFAWTFWERCSIAAKAICFYIGKLFWPAQLSLVYPKWESNSHGFLFLGLFLFAVLLSIGFVKSISKNAGKGVIAAVLVFVINAAPTLGFLNVSFFTYSFVANWWLYLPSISLIALFAVAWEQLWRKLGRAFVPSVLKFIATISILLVLSSLTVQRVLAYRDEETVWRDTVNKNPKSAWVHFNLGVTLQRNGKMFDAVKEYEETLQFEPRHPGARNNLSLLKAQ